MTGPAEQLPYRVLLVDLDDRARVREEVAALARRVIGEVDRPAAGVAVTVRSAPFTPRVRSATPAAPTSDPDAFTAAALDGLERSRRARPPGGERAPRPVRLLVVRAEFAR